MPPGPEPQSSLRERRAASGDTAAPEAALQLDQARALYFLPRDNFAAEVLIPAFGCAVAARCMAGFFSSGVLAELAPGLATFVQRHDTKLRLLISPYLSEADQRALEAGLRSPEELALEALDTNLFSVEGIQKHTLLCLSYLLATDRLEVRIAVMRNALFHPKVWIFDTPRGPVAAHGSSNMTQSGLRRNKEQITVSLAWMDPTQRYVVNKLSDEFEMLWRGEDPDCCVVPLPEATRSRLLREYHTTEPPTEDEFLRLFRIAKNISADTRADEIADAPLQPQTGRFVVPSWLNPDDGPYAHQGKAVAAWVAASYRGTLAMATGSGKTLTSMLAAYRLYEASAPLLIVVAAPYVPLIQQWCDEVEHFGIRAVNLSAVGNALERGRVLQQLRRRLRLGVSRVEVIVVSHDTLCTPAFTDAIAEFECARLLIADEAHNLGRATFLANQPEFFEHRLALSATPVRQYDPEGTDAIFAFFGPVVFSYSLEEAIGTCLVPYDYLLHPVPLTSSEMELWAELSERIRENAWRQDNGKPDDYLAKLFRDRRLVLEIASRKVDCLEALLCRERLRELKHTLIYTTDKGPDQLEQVNALLSRLGVLFHQLTAEETSNRETTSRIIRSFQSGEIQVLTAKRVLDEGVNIPQITRAYILASTTVERQWIQRRGRLLRTCPEIGKTHSIIHDLLALPPSLDEKLDQDARALVRSELRRAQEFAALARNAGRDDGPLPTIHRLVRAALM